MLSRGGGSSKCAAAAAPIAPSLMKASDAKLLVLQVAQLQHKLKVAEAAAEAAAKRAEQEAEFRIDVAQVGKLRFQGFKPRTRLFFKNGK